MIIKEFQSSVSLLDYLDDKNVQSDIYHIVLKPRINNKAAKTLYKIWKNENNLIEANVLFKPYDLPIEDVDALEKEGLIDFYRDQMHITPKGASVLKVMILGDNRSVFEDDGSILDYKTAELNTKPLKKTGKIASTQQKIQPYNYLKYGHSLH